MLGRGNSSWTKVSIHPDLISMTREITPREDAQSGWRGGGEGGVWQVTSADQSASSFVAVAVGDAINLLTEPVVLQMRNQDCRASVVSRGEVPPLLKGLKLLPRHANRNKIAITNRKLEMFLSEDYLFVLNTQQRNILLVPVSQNTDGFKSLQPQRPVQQLGISLTYNICKSYINKSWGKSHLDSQWKVHHHNINKRVNTQMKLWQVRVCSRHYV